MLKQIIEGTRDEIKTPLLTASEHSALFDLWRNLHNRGNTFEDAQDYCNEVNLINLQSEIAFRTVK